MERLPLMRPPTLWLSEGCGLGLSYWGARTVIFFEGRTMIVFVREKYSGFRLQQRTMLWLRYFRRFLFDRSIEVLSRPLRNHDVIPVFENLSVISIQKVYAEARQRFEAKPQALLSRPTEKNVMKHIRITLQIICLVVWRLPLGSMKIRQGIGSIMWIAALHLCRKQAHILFLQQ